MKIAGVAAIALLGLLLACSSSAEERVPTPITTPVPTQYPPPVFTEPPSATPDPGMMTAFKENRARWTAISLRDYQFKFTIGCFCFFDNQPISMVVRDGQLVSMTNVLGELVTANDYDVFYPYATVEGMFNRVDEAIQKNWYVDIKYDPIYGFPYQMNIHNRIPDSGVFVTINDFEASK